jgi:hypothetical protein
VKPREFRACGLSPVGRLHSLLARLLWIRAAGPDPSGLALSVDGCQTKHHGREFTQQKPRLQRSPRHPFYLRTRLAAILSRIHRPAFPEQTIWRPRYNHLGDLTRESPSRILLFSFQFFHFFGKNQPAIPPQKFFKSCKKDIAHFRPSDYKLCPTLTS